MDDDKIVINPFERKNLSTSSYDVSLGEWFYREQTPPLPKDIFNIYNDGHVAKVWGEPQQAKNAAKELGIPLCDEIGFPTNRRVIMIDPGETILAHTYEFIGGRKDITSMMKARSSMGRCFITVCKCAGWGDVGYFNRWTMEITNVSRYYAIPLMVGSRVAQIIFEETGRILDKDYTADGNYQKTQSINELIMSWKPEMMLPKVRP